MSLVEVVAARDGRTLVFANSAPRAEEARRVLVGAGVACACYHPNVPPEERAARLASFAASADGVLVCSGLAARGIDVPDVRLVVEFQMAPNLVDHLHRVGRTARAQRDGRAVSLTDPQSKREVALVAQVQRCEAGGWKYL